MQAKAFTIFCIVFCNPFPLVKIANHSYRKCFSDKSLFQYDVAFGKEAATAGCTYWSHMNPDPCKFILPHQLHQAPQHLPSYQQQQSILCLLVTLSPAGTATLEMTSSVARFSLAAGFVTHVLQWEPSTHPQPLPPCSQSMFLDAIKVKRGALPFPGFLAHPHHL